MAPFILTLADDPIPWIDGNQWVALGIWLAAGVVLIALGLLPRWLHRPKSPVCPKCRFDMRAATSRLCTECGHVARSESALQQRGRIILTLVVLGLIVLAVYPARRTIAWSKDRGWSPPLPAWKVVERVELPNGAVAELLETRNFYEFGRKSRIRTADGRSRDLEGHHFALGAQIGRNETHLVGRGEDITGDGRSNLVIVEWTGGNRCCNIFHIFELRPDGTLKDLAVLDAHVASGFEDLDGDGVYEFVAYDWSLAYKLTCFACLAYPKVVLRWSEGRYTVAADLMRQQCPSDEDIAAIILASQTNDWSGTDNTVRDRLWGIMLKLIYSGHESQAWWLFDQCWPADAPNRDLERATFLEAIEQSPYRQAVLDLQVSGEVAESGRQGG